MKLPNDVAPEIHEPQQATSRHSGKGPGIGTRWGGGNDGDGGDDKNKNEDNWDSWPQGSRGPHERLIRYRWGIGLTLAAIFIFFLVLGTTFLVRQSAGHWDGKRHTWERSSKPVTLPPLLWVNSFVLLISSVTMEKARRTVFDESYQMQEWLGMGRPTAASSLPWLGVSALLGLGFIVGQLLAWSALRAKGIYFASNAGSDLFYLITGAHALHLLGGIAALIYVLTISFLKKELGSRQIAVDTATWYWHGMGMLWAGLFATMLMAP